MEFVLGFVSLAPEDQPFVCISVDTDGTDGPTDFAGAIADNRTAAVMRHAGIDIRTALKRHDTLPAMKRVQGAIETGATGTNVMNLRVVLVP